MSLDEPGAPGEEAQAAILRTNALLTLPRLLDAAALYAPTDLATTRALCAAVLSILPELGPAWEAALPDLAANLGGVRAGLVGEAASLRAGKSSGGLAAVLSSISLLRDTAATLAAASAACPPPFAPAILAAGGGCVPAVLASLHDDLVPDLAASLRGAGATGVAGTAEVREKKEWRKESQHAPDPSWGDNSLFPGVTAGFTRPLPRPLSLFQSLLEPKLRSDNPAGVVRAHGEREGGGWEGGCWVRPVPLYHLFFLSLSARASSRRPGYDPRATCSLTNTLFYLSATLYRLSPRWTPCGWTWRTRWARR